MKIVKTASNEGLLNKEGFKYAGDINKYSNSNLYLLYIQNKLVGYCVAEILDKSKLLGIIVAEFGEEKNSEVYDDVRNLNAEEFLFIHLLEISNTEQKQGYGKELVNHIKGLYKEPIVVQTVEDSEVFWDRLGFEELLSYFKIYKEDINGNK